MKTKPNFLFILSDDQGAWAMHCAGTPEFYTPNLDRIAESGMRFENFFCVSPVCSPARASLLTGKIPSAHGVLDWIRSGNVDGEKFAAQGKENPYGTGYRYERTPIAYLEGQTAYTDILARNGYTCALSGKWHLGDSVTPQHGFRKWYTLGLGGCCYYHPDIVEEGRIHIEHGHYVTELLTDKALEYLDEMSREEKPFYLAVHYTAPHSPWEREQHPSEWIDHYENCAFESIPDVPDHPDLLTGPVYGTERRKVNLRGYFAAVSAMDRQIGRLLDALEEKGLAGNTIVIFTADNGMSMGQHGIWGKGNGTFPMNMYDSAVKVPFMISWPGRIPAGIVNEAMASGYDMFPTILELAGIENPVEKELPGKSFAECVMSTGAERPEEKGRRNKEAGAASDADDEAVVIYDEYGPVRMIRSREWKYIHRYPYGKHELYHLSEDPGEERNLYSQSEYMDMVLKLRRQMEKWFQQYVDPGIDGTKEGVTGSGQICRPGIYADRAEVYPPVGV